MKKVIELKLIDKYEDDKLMLNNTGEFGVKSNIGPRSMLEELVLEINRNKGEVNDG